MLKTNRDPSWHRKQIVVGCVMLYLLMAVCCFFWVTDYEMPFKLKAILFALGVAIPTRILMDLNSFIKKLNYGESKNPEE